MNKTIRLCFAVFRFLFVSFDKSARVYTSRHNALFLFIYLFIYLFIHLFIYLWRNWCSNQLTVFYFKVSDLILIITCFCCCLERVWFCFVVFCCCLVLFFEGGSGEDLGWWWFFFLKKTKNFVLVYPKNISFTSRYCWFYVLANCWV